jgi:hypothetical protein
MKLITKRTQCPKCQKLVRGKEQTSDNELKIVCPKCNTAIWTRQDKQWKYTKPNF